jgi:hypothetical protein
MTVMRTSQRLLNFFNLEQKYNYCTIRSWDVAQRISKKIDTNVHISSVSNGVFLCVVERRLDVHLMKNYTL